MVESSSKFATGPSALPSSKGGSGASSSGLEEAAAVGPASTFTNRFRVGAACTH